MLSESAASLARWRTDTIRAFDGDAAVLIDVIPELRILLGPDYKIEPLADLGPAERESRFRNAFGRLLAVFGRKGVVIFLDDLQWCSHSEFMLISNIAEETNRRVRDWGYQGAIAATPQSSNSSTPSQTTSWGSGKQSRDHKRGMERGWPSRSICLSCPFLLSQLLLARGSWLSRIYG